MEIRQDLLMRVKFVYDFFFAQWQQVPLYRYPFPMAPQMPEASIPEIDEYASDDSSTGSSSAGTAGLNITSNNNAAATHVAKGHSLKDLVAETDDGGEQGGEGGGTMTGLRGENDPAASLRTLSAP